MFYKIWAKVKPVFVFLVCSSLLLSWSFVSYNTELSSKSYAKNERIWLTQELHKKNNQPIINTTGCLIEYMDPFSEDILPFVKDPEQIECDGDILTYISNEGGDIYLNVNQSIAKNESLVCRYQLIDRSVNSEEMVPDKQISAFSSMVEFKSRTILKTETLIQVLCENNYENFHYIFQTKDNAKQYKRSKYNVLMVGLDAVSRSNLLRTMPKTVEFLRQNGWVDLKGYNKILHNTCPNLMAVLTGVNPENSGCEDENPTWMDYKDFVWNYYKDENYTTLFSEDLPVFSTFNYGKLGFWNNPTDYYLRPYYLGLNSYLPTKVYCNEYQCFGPENIGPRMLQFVKEYIAAVKNRNNAFAFFWMNSFSHSDLNCPSHMDDQMVQLFQHLKYEGVFEDTFVVFFSDHGFRFGKIVETHTGWLENRLPFNFISVPELFRLHHKEKYHNLLQNSERLTSPYDLHVTLHHILHLYNHSHSMRSASGCPFCHSLFEPISVERTCSDAGIPEYWCACSKYTVADKNESLAQNASNFAVKHINELLQTTECAKYTLKDILEVKYHETSQKMVKGIMLRILLEPPAKFDLNIDVRLTENETVEFNLQGVERLDRYADISWCCQDTGLRKYCYCI